MKAVEITSNIKPRREPPATLPDVAALYVIQGIPRCIHVRKAGARPFVVTSDLVYCFDCHDLFLSWNEHQQAQAAA